MEIDDQIRELCDRIRTQPGRAALIAAVELDRAAAALRDGMAVRYMTDTTGAGYWWRLPSWTDLGQRLGVSRQAAQKRYGAAVAAAGRKTSRGR